jgi:hypothetical protein
MGSRWASLGGIGAPLWRFVGIGGQRGEKTTESETEDMRERRGLACRTLRGVGTEWLNASDGAASYVLEE